MINLVMAMDMNQAIGLGNQLPWHLPADLAYFKQLTKGKMVVMGRKTFESLPVKPLPDRINVVLTRNPDFSFPGVLVYNSVCKLMKDAENIDLYVIGGANIYKIFLPVANRLYVTHIYDTFLADTFLNIDFSKWEKHWRKVGSVDEKNPYEYEFVLYRRKWKGNLR